VELLVVLPRQERNRIDRRRFDVLNGKVILQPRQPQRLDFLEPLLVDQGIECFDVFLKGVRQFQVKRLFGQSLCIGGAEAPVEEDDLLEKQGVVPIAAGDLVDKLADRALHFLPRLDGLRDRFDPSNNGLEFARQGLVRELALEREHQPLVEVRLKPAEGILHQGFLQERLSLARVTTGWATSRTPPPEASRAGRSGLTCFRGGFAHAL
jgi:hypothetical protein